MGASRTLQYTLIVWLAGAAPLLASSPAEIAKEAFASTVLVVIEDAHGEPVLLGSGFVLREHTIVTNMHVIDGAYQGYVKQIDSDTKYKLEAILQTDKSHDLAVLLVPSLSAPALPIGDSTKLAVGDTVYAVGNPRGLEGTFSQGIVSSIRHIDSGTLLQITAPISPGSSGGPILNEHGEVVGVAVGHIQRRAESELCDSRVLPFDNELLRKTPPVCFGPEKTRALLKINIGRITIRFHSAIRGGPRKQ